MTMKRDCVPHGQSLSGRCEHFKSEVDHTEHTSHEVYIDKETCKIPRIDPDALCNVPCAGLWLVPAHEEEGSGLLWRTVDP